MTTTPAKSRRERGEKKKTKNILLKTPRLHKRGREKERDSANRK